MDVTTYKEALEQAKKDLAKANEKLAIAQEQTVEAEHEIIELRETIAALAKLCGESEYVEEDALGLTDAIRMVLKADKSSDGLSPHEIRERMEKMGYGGRWANVLASIHTVVKRLNDKKEVEAIANGTGSYNYRWAAHPKIRNATSYRSSTLTGRNSSAPRK